MLQTLVAARTRQGHKVVFLLISLGPFSQWCRRLAEHGVSRALPHAIVKCAGAARMRASRAVFRLLPWAAPLYSCQSLCCQLSTISLQAANGRGHPVTVRHAPCYEWQPQQPQHVVHACCLQSA